MSHLGFKKDKEPNTNQPNVRTGKKPSAASLRMQNELNDLSLPSECHIQFPDPNDLQNFLLILKPDKGYYKDGRFEFLVQISSEYPVAPPNIKCQTKLFHPNIDLEGNVCLNILRGEWTPLLDINSIAYDLVYLFHNPNCTDPLNKEAAEMLLSSPCDFENVVKSTILGGMSYSGDSLQ